MRNALKCDTILELELSGKLAHFRKFYTNASSLTYSIPPRTAICGLVASILELPRDSYYESLDSNHLGVAISLTPHNEHRKQFYTMNYVGDDKDIGNTSVHKQCRLELLLPAPGKELKWYLYLGYNSDPSSCISKLEERIIAQNLGFDVYLGQRQFRSGICLRHKYTQKEFKILTTSDYVDSAVDKEKVHEFEHKQFRINIERMPVEQELEEQAKKRHRKTVRVADVVIEISGNRLIGKFSDLIELENEKKTRIAFL